MSSFGFETAIDQRERREADTQRFLEGIWGEITRLEDKLIEKALTLRPGMSRTADTTTKQIKASSEKKKHIETFGLRLLLSKLTDNSELMSSALSELEQSAVRALCERVLSDIRRFAVSKEEEKMLQAKVFTCFSESLAGSFQTAFNLAHIK